MLHRSVQLSRTRQYGVREQINQEEGGGGGSSTVGAQAFSPAPLKAQGRKGHFAPLMPSKPPCSWIQPNILFVSHSRCTPVRCAFPLASKRSGQACYTSYLSKRQSSFCAAGTLVLKGKVTLGNLTPCKVGWPPCALGRAQTPTLPGAVSGSQR